MELAAQDFNNAQRYLDGRIMLEISTSSEINHLNLWNTENYLQL